MSNTPVEILAHIFHYLFRKPIEVACVESSDVRCVPWAVGEVCKHWRDVFLTTPSFWASVSLTTYSHNIGAQLAAKAYRLLAMCLKNSEEHPLDVTVAILNQKDDCMTPAVRLLLSQSYRWKRAKLFLVSAQQMDEILTRERVPILQSITLTTHLADPPDLGAFKIAPCLTHANLEYNGKYHSWVLSWSQLTKLEIYFVGLYVGRDGRALEFLHQLTYIEELRIYIDIGNFPDNLNTPTVRLSFLRQLDVDSPKLLSLIEAPLLSKLYLQFCSSPSSYPQELRNLIDRSRCQIRQLSLHPDSIDIESVVSLLAAVDIEELDVFTAGSYFERNSPMLLLFPPDRLCPLSRLRILRSYFCFGYGLPARFSKAASQLLLVVESLGTHPREEHNAGAILPSIKEVIIEFRVDHTGHDFVITEIPKELLEAVAKWSSNTVQVVIRVLDNGRVVHSVNSSNPLEVLRGF